MRSSPLWILYSLAMALIGVVLVVTTGGRAGVILIIGGVLGAIIRWFRFSR